MYGKGISREGSLLDVGVDLGIVKKSGAWFTYEGEQLGQGRENAKSFLADNPEIMVEISEKIRVQVGIGNRPSDGSDARARRRARVRVDDEPISSTPDARRSRRLDPAAVQRRVGVADGRAVT